MILLGHVIVLSIVFESILCLVSSAPVTLRLALSLRTDRIDLSSAHDEHGPDDTKYLYNNFRWSYGGLDSSEERQSRTSSYGENDRKRDRGQSASAVYEASLSQTTIFCGRQSAFLTGGCRMSSNTHGQIHFAHGGE